MCQQFGVCQSTINYVLDDLQKAGLIERRPWRGIFISEGAKRQRIGVVFDRNVFRPGFSPVYSQLVTEAERRAKAGREEVRFYIDVARPSGHFPSHSDLMTDLESGHLHGLIFVGIRSEEDLQLFAGQPIPSVFFEPRWNIPNSVRIDYAALVVQGVACLAARGCRRIGLVSHLKGRVVTSPHFSDYPSLFRHATETHGLQADENWILETAVQSPSDPEILFPSHEEIAHHSLRDKAKSTAPSPSGNNFPDGFLVTDDMHACGILIALEREFGLRVGKDIHVATHSNRGSAALFGYETNLERLEIDPSHLVDALFEIIEEQIRNGKKNRDAVIISPRLLPSERTSETPMENASSPEARLAANAA